MGGVLIKVGQFLSTRVDVLPPEFTDELQGLQDEVPPVDFKAIRNVAEEELGCPLDDRYVFFEQEPLAAASLGQVHRAKLYPADAIKSHTKEKSAITQVVVKIQRPNIEQIIDTDLAALRTVGSWLKRYPPIRKRADVPALINEFARILYEEVDYLAEGRNAETFAHNFSQEPSIRVPQVVWGLTTKRVLTLENVWAIKITDYDRITQAGISREQVASRLLDTYLKQIFEDGFFHADPHPGNLFVRPLNGTLRGSGVEADLSWQLTFVDFGMVGRVPATSMEGMREMLIGIATQDSARVVKSYQMLGVLLPSADLALLEKAGARVFERFWGKTMTELNQISPEEIREFTREFRDLLYTMPFQIPQDFIFLARTVGILSGMCTGLNPEFNVWDHITPYARKLLAAEARPIVDFWIEELRSFFSALVTYPKRVNAVLTKLERGEIAVQTPELSKQVARLERTMDQVVVGIVFAAFFLGAVQVYLAGEQYLSLLLALFALLSLIWIFVRKIG
jgi:predicted unusual protein kinase regulating ubiquinone biosynthesis (AarF/ABC1/UbiB family)